MISFFKNRVVLVLILLTLIYYLPGVFSPRDFWVEDEARYAEVLREMVHDGEWMVPYLNGSFYPDKPPIYFWLCAFVALLIGKITPAGCMIITLLSTLGTVLVAYHFGVRLFDKRSGFLGAVVLLSTFLFLGCAQIVRMDMLLTFFCTLAIYVFYLGWIHQNTRYFALFYFLTALAVLSKGPFGFFFTFLPVVCFLIQKRAWRTLRRLVFHWGFLLFFLCVGVWLGLSWLTGHADFVKNLFLEQMAGRAVKAFSHREPVYFYFLLLPFVFLPWTGFLIRAIQGIRKDMSDGVWLLFWWFVSGLIVISAVSGKLFIYLLPMIPPATIVMGVFFSKLLSDKTLLNRSFQAEGIIAVLFTFGLFAVLPLFANRFPSMQGTNFWPLTVVFLPLFVIGMALSLMKKGRALLILLITGMWLFSGMTMLFLVPQVNHLVSAKQIGREIARFTNQGRYVATFRVRRGILNFYAGQTIPALGIGDLPEYLDEPENILILKKNEYEKQREKWNREIRIVSRYEISNEHYVVLTPGTGEKK